MRSGAGFTVCSVSHPCTWHLLRSRGCVSCDSCPAPPDRQRRMGQARNSGCWWGGGADRAEEEEGAS